MTFPVAGWTGARCLLAAFGLSLTLGAIESRPALANDTVSRLPVQMAQAAPAGAPTASAESKAPFDAAQKAAIEAIIKDYLLANPEVMLEVQTALESRMEKLQAERLAASLETNAAEIFRSSDAPTAGNPQGDITVVEFFDYNCGYCKRAFTDLAKLVEDDSKVKLVLKELPILSKGS